MKERVKVLISWVIGLLFFLGISYSLFYLIRYFGNIFVTLDKQVAAGIIAASATVIVSVVTVVIGKHLEKKKEIEHQLRIQKTEIYERFMEKMFKIMAAKGNYPEKEMTKFLEEFSRKLILWGGRKVIATYCTFRNIGTQNSETSDQRILLYFEKVLFSIRRDLGHSNRGLNSGNLLTLFINDPTEVKEIVSKYPNI